MEREPNEKVQVPVSRRSDAKRTVLFVDDEPRILEALRSAFNGREAEWDMVFVSNAEAAMSEIRTRRFDVIVSDLGMPGIDGATLLGRVREMSPSTVRILLANESERDAAVRASAVCHQSLTKPCTTEALKVAIDRTLGLKGLLENERVRAIVGKIDHLPVLPRVYSELNAAFASPDCSPSQIARIVEGDPAISAGLLKLVNSAFFALGQRMTSPERAIVYLGLDLVRSLALTTKVFSTRLRKTVPGFSMDELQAQSFLTGLMARRIPKSPQARDDAATAGLLHDVGRLIFASECPDQYAKVLRRVREGKGVAIEQAERDELGASHAEVGAYLVGLWGLPSTIVEGIAYHHEPSRAPAMSEVIRAVHVGSVLVDREFRRQRGDRSAELPRVDRSVDVYDDVDAWGRTAANDVERWRGDSAAA
jgi:HD-like signal output (HDOD) protein